MAGDRSIEVITKVGFTAIIVLSCPVISWAGNNCKNGIGIQLHFFIASQFS